MARVDLIGKLYLNLRVTDGAGRRPGTDRRSDGEFPRERATADRLVAASASDPAYARRAVFRQQIKESAAGDIGIKLINTAIGGDRADYVRPPEDHHYLSVRDHRSAKIGQMRSGGRTLRLDAAAASRKLNNTDDLLTLIRIDRGICLALRWIVILVLPTISGIVLCRRRCRTSLGNSA